MRAKMSQVLSSFLPSRAVFCLLHRHTPRSMYLKSHETCRLCIFSNDQPQLPSFIQTKRHCHIRGMNGSFLTFLLFFNLSSPLPCGYARDSKKKAASSTTELTKQIKTSLAPAFFFSFFCFAMAHSTAQSSGAVSATQLQQNQRIQKIG